MICTNWYYTQLTESMVQFDSECTASQRLAVQSNAEISSTVNSFNSQGHGRFASVRPNGGVSDASRVPIDLLVRRRELEVTQ